MYVETKLKTKSRGHRNHSILFLCRNINSLDLFSMLIYLQQQNGKYKLKYWRGLRRPGMSRLSTTPSNEVWVIVSSDRQKSCDSMIGERETMPWPSTLSVHILFVGSQLETLLFNTKLNQVKMDSKSSGTGFPEVTKAQFKSYVLGNYFKTYTYLGLPRSAVWAVW